MSISRKSISIQSQMCGSTQVVVLIVREPVNEWKRLRSRIERKLKRLIRKFARYMSRNWFYILLGLWFTSKSIDAAYEFRGYEAIGSEYLVLPMFLLLIEALRTGIRFCKEV